ncbi:MAG: endopeptidase La [Lachnospiraceae bacterium]|nr:endopeptidase La [Lachnospiraceae bacterium]
MKIIPISNSLILANTKIQLSGTYLEKMDVGDIKPDEELILLIKKDSEGGVRFQPVAFLGKASVGEMSDDVTINVGERVRVDEVDLNNQYVTYHSYPEIEDVNKEEAMKKLVDIKEQMISVFGPMINGGEAVPRMYLSRAADWNQTAVMSVPYLHLSSPEKYEVMKAEKESEKIDLLTKYIQKSLAIIEVANEAQNNNDESYKQLYRESAIKKQIEYLQKELDELHPENKSDIQLFEEKIEDSGMNEQAKKEAEKVIKRLKTEGESGHEYGMLTDYLEFVTSLDWKKHEAKDIDINRAKDILDKEHFGLEKVKKRIVEQMAVMSLSKKQSGSILLLVGAPGTGKTSIAKSIADGLDREYVRISLGGVKDEADIRGHRRTYIGAMPGRIMDGIKKAGTSNPVIVLDEIDKLSTSYSGDPASALLEVLDPEQNNTFTDHYMNVPYDLSDVMFICTANTLDTIPGPLLDRMEIINFNGYTPTEKLHIAKNHLIKKSMEKSGVSEENLSITDDAYEKIISNYTMEAGVRGLKKQLDKLTRIAAVKTVSDGNGKIEVTSENLSEYMDQREIHHEKIHETTTPGIVTGLAWTPVGGEILFIETMLTKGSGKVQITGQLGDVMKESAQIAVSLVKKMYPEKAEVFEENDIHIHVPAGATPKDGPSAGITLTTALSSLINEKPVDSEYAMTGEVSLRGDVMPIGGLPEKLMAAQRAGVRSVFIPKENEYDLKDVAPEVLKELTIIPVERVDEVVGKVM